MAKAKKVAKKPVKKKKPLKVKAQKPAAKGAKPAKPGKAAKAAPKAAASKSSKGLAKEKAAKPAKAAKAEKPVKVEAKESPKPKASKVKVIAAEVEVEVVDIEVQQEPEVAQEVVLTDAEGRRYCRVKDCDQLATVDAYCRYHYLLFWKRIQVRKKILTEGKLERYIEELTARYPDKFLDMLRKDLRSEKEFLAAIQELEIDESQNEAEFEDESENFIDEVRGMSEPQAREEEDF